MRPFARESARQARAARRARASDPGFRVDRLTRSLLTADSGFAEILIGGWLVVLRGVTLAVMGWLYGRVGHLLDAFTITPSRLGFILVAVGVAQILLTGTCYYRARSAVAFVGAFACLLVVLAYLGSDLEHTAAAWSWAALMVSEAFISWRALLNQLAMAHAASGNGVPPA